MKKRNSVSIALLIMIGVTISGCRSADAEGKNVRRTEFRISSVPESRLGYGVGMSGSDKDSVNERISENWRRDLILGRGTVLCTEPHK